MNEHNNGVLLSLAAAVPTCAPLHVHVRVHVCLPSSIESGDHRPLTSVQCWSYMYMYMLEHALRVVALESVVPFLHVIILWCQLGCL